MAEGNADQGQSGGHLGQIRSVAFSPDCRRLASGGDDGVIRVWDARTGSRCTQLAGHTAGVRSVGFSPDGKRMASGGDEGVVRVWDLDTGSQRAQLIGHTAGVRSVAFSPDGKKLASGGDDGVVRVWDAGAGEQRAQLAGHAAGVRSVAFSPDGLTLASGGGGDGAIQVWDVRTSKQRTQLPGHGGWVLSVAFSPDGKALASGGDDGVVRVWDVGTGKQRAEFAGHTGWVWSVVFSPDGTTVASGGDQSIRVWTLRNGIQILVTGAGVPRSPGRPLAGISSDSPNAEDLIGVDRDVEVLADLIAAADTRPPLAIALIGSWGAGKSSFMLQVEQRIRILAEMSRNNPASAFAATVRQVRFNAWHYSDDHLWAGLVSHLFRSLAAFDGQEPAEPCRSADLEDLQQERVALRSKLADRQAHELKLARTLAVADEIPQPPAFLGWLGSPRYVAYTTMIATREALRDMRASWPILISWAVLAAAAVAFWHVIWPQIVIAATVLAAVAVPIVMALLKLRLGHRTLMRFTAARRRDLAARRRTAQQEIGEIRERLSVIDAASRLGGFLAERGSSLAYGHYRSLLGRVHDDLLRLSEDLAQARAEWIASGSAFPPPLERIVLYIDDLDRCPPYRVVEVLEAVHLMLALDLFIVITAVDARWLIRSLQHHHHEHFGRPGSSASADRPWASQDRQATAIDYLDKIFQIPYTLPPLQPAAAGAYLRALLPEPALTDEAGPPAGPADSLLTAVIDARAGDDDPPGAQPAGTLQRHAGLRAASVPGQRPAPSAIRRSAADAPDLNPRRLRLSSGEVELIARLGALTPTPRAAKKMANLYRLVRISIRESELAAFIGSKTDGPYQVVQILLAILISSPGSACEIFQRLLAASENDEFITVLKANGFDHIASELEKIDQERRLPESISEYQRWCPIIARYSFAYHS